MKKKGNGDLIYFVYLIESINFMENRFVSIFSRIFRVVFLFCFSFSSELFRADIENAFNKVSRQSTSRDHFLYFGEKTRRKKNACLHFFLFVVLESWKSHLLIFLSKIPILDFFFRFWYSLFCFFSGFLFSFSFSSELLVFWGSILRNRSIKSHVNPFTR